MTLPNKFTFRHVNGGGSLYTACVEGAGVRVTWPGDAVGVVYHLEDAKEHVTWGRWQEVGVPLNDLYVAAPVPSLVEQLIATAALNTYDLAFEPGGYIRLQGMHHGSRGVRLKSVELALQWFGLMAQLTAVEAGGS